MNSCGGCLARKRKLADAGAGSDLAEISRWQMIPCIVYPPYMPEGLMRAVEIIESLRRHDLTREQRQKFASECLSWLEEQKKEVSLDRVTLSRDQRAAKADTWFAEWYSWASIPKNTAENWWNDYISSTGHEKVTPSER